MASFSIDIDGTICDTPGTDYSRACPNDAMIAAVNALHDDGHSIVYHTGRRWDRLELTLRQLADWGCRYSTLVMGKPAADYIIDDRAIEAGRLVSAVRRSRSDGWPIDAAIEAEL